MNRAEMRRKAREQEKTQLPLNSNLTLAQIAGMTGQQVSILQTYLKRKEQETTENVKDAIIREAQEKLERAEDYIAIINILISLYAIKMTWGFTEENKRFLDNYNAARNYVDRIGAAKANLCILTYPPADSLLEFRKYQAVLQWKQPLFHYHR